MRYVSDRLRVGRVVALLAGVMVLFFAGQARAQWGERADADQPIEQGLIVIDGKVLPPPYTVRTDAQGETTVNGLSVVGWFAEPGERGDEDHVGDPDRWQPRRWTAQRVLSRWLERDRVFLVASGVGCVVIDLYQLPEFVEAVSGDQPEQEKLDRLAVLTYRPASDDLWRALIAAGVSDPELQRRSAQEKAQQDSFAAHREAHQDEQARRDIYQMLLPMLAIGGVLLAVAILLHTLRQSWDDPQEHRGWRHIDPTGKRTRAVIQLLAVLVLLNAMDLLFTILANQTGAFIELSPVAGELVNSPVALGFYKTTLVALGVCILLLLRQRRAAEVTAWWLCALYVLVLVRWVAVNTVLLA